MSCKTALIPSLLLLAKNLSSPDRFRFVVLLGVTLSMALFELAITGLVALMAAVFGAPNAAMQLKPLVFAQEIFPSLFGDDARIIVFIILLAILFVIFLKNCLLVVQQILSTALSEALSNATRAKIFSFYLRAPYLWTLKTSTSDMLFVLFSSARLGHILTNLVLLFSNVVMLATVVCALIITSPLSSFLFFGIIGGGGLVILRSVRKTLADRSAAVFEGEMALHGLQQMSVNALKEMRLYKREQNLQQQYQTNLSNVLVAKKRQEAFSKIPTGALEVLGFSALAAILATLIFVQDESMITISTTIGFLAAAAWRCLPVANRLMDGITQMRKLHPYLESVISQLHQEEKLQEQLLSLEDSQAETLSFTKELVVDDVSFTYPEAARPALRNISFSITPGQFYGIVGLSGSGKTTLVNILTGLIPPDSGAIATDGQAITLKNCRSWLDKVGYVPQFPYLLDATIAENIALSRWGEALDRERILACCAQASLDFIDQLPDDIDTVIGERGAKLSGGQIQRVAIARALYSNPELIIFDEATSALDIKNETAIRETILSLKNRVTILIIAHRVSSIEDAEKLVWMEDGAIKRIGPTDEILPDYLHALENSQQQ